MSQRILEILQPDQIEIAFRAVQELERRSQAVDQQWRMRLERLEYQAQLAQRRYEEVDPSNRLVAATLEQRWNQALQEKATAQEELNRQRQQQGLELTEEQKEPIAGFGQRPAPALEEPLDFRPGPQADAAFAHQGHHGGKAGWPNEKPCCTFAGKAVRSKILASIFRCPPQIKSAIPKRLVDRVRALALSLTDPQIVAALNQEGIERQGQALHAEHDQMDPVSACHPGAIVKAARGTDRRGSRQAL